MTPEEIQILLLVVVGWALGIGAVILSIIILDEWMSR